MTYSTAYGYRWFMNVYDILLPPTGITGRSSGSNYSGGAFNFRKRTMFWHVLAKILWGYIIWNLGLKNMVGTATIEVPEMAIDNNELTISMGV